MFTQQLFLALRPQQWVKNVLIFFPLIFGKKLFIYPVNLRSVAAFVFFCMASSAVYLINDIIDLPRDKTHPVKKLRPVVAGTVSIRQAVFLAVILGSLSIVCSLAVDIYFGYVVIAYFIFNLVYSKALKDIAIINVLCIGGFFFLRLISGSLIAKVRMSRWIIIITVLLALFLGSIKRRRELMMLQVKGRLYSRAPAGYPAFFINPAITAITFAILIAYTLYVLDPRTVNEFRTRSLWYSVPFVYLGIFRYLYLIKKNSNDADPTRIFWSDKKMQLIVACWVIVCTAVIYF